MRIEKRGRYWAVSEGSGKLICLTVYKKGAQEIVRRLNGKRSSKFDKFWVVLKPDQKSSLGDILFETSATCLSVNAGMKPNQIYAFYLVHDKAIRKAERLLRRYEYKRL